MPKFWLPSEEILNMHYTMLNEDVWFERCQPLLLQMANTRFGRDLLCISQDYPRIVKMTKNSVHCLVEVNGEMATVLADFRVGAKWANVIRFRWWQFVSYARYFDFRMPVPIVRREGISALTSANMAMSLSTLTVYPDPDPETTTVDGWAGWYSSSESYTATHDTSVGNQAFASSGAIEMEQGNEGVGFHVIKRGSCLFDTSPLTAGASISAGTCSFYGNSKSQTYKNDIRLVTSNPASNTNVTTSDYLYTKYSTAAQATADITYDNWSTAAYNDYTLDATGISNVSKTGITKFGLRFEDDCSVTDPGGDLYCYISAKSADTAGTGSDPKLVITYTISSSMLGIERTPIRGVMRGTMRP